MFEDFLTEDFEVRSIGKRIPDDGRDHFESLLMKPEFQFIENLDYDTFINSKMRIKAIIVKNKTVYIGSLNGEQIVTEDARDFGRGAEGTATRTTMSSIIDGLLVNQKLFDSDATGLQKVPEFAGCKLSGDARLNIREQKYMQHRVYMPAKHFLIECKDDLECLKAALAETGVKRFQAGEMIIEYISDDENNGRESVWKLRAVNFGDHEYEFMLAGVEKKGTHDLSGIRNYRKLSDIIFLFDDLIVQAVCEKVVKLKKDGEPGTYIQCEYHSHS